MDMSIAADCIERFCTRLFYDSRPLLFLDFAADLIMLSSGAADLFPPNEGREGSEMDGKDHPADFFGAALALDFNIAPLLLLSHPSSLLSHIIARLSTSSSAAAYLPLPDLLLLTGEGCFGLFIGMFTSIDSLLVESISLSEAIRAVRLCRT